MGGLRHYGGFGEGTDTMAGRVTAGGASYPSIEDPF
jgi:hypothetical protein